MRITFAPTKGMIARWLIGIGILLVVSTAFGQEPAAAPTAKPATASAADAGPLATPIAQARTNLQTDASATNRLALADLLFRRAEFQLGLAARATDAARIGALTTDAGAAVAEAAETITPALTKLKSARAAAIAKGEAEAKPGEEPAGPAPDLESQLQQVWLLDGQIRLMRGELALRAAGADEGAKRAARQLLLGAITSCSDLEWEYDGWYVAYWSHITQARCFGAMGRTSDAVANLGGILALPKDAATASVRTEAYRRLAELQLQLGRYAEAVDTFATASQDYPQLLASRTGQTLQLLVGTAHAKAGQHDQAVGAAIKVIEAERKLRYRAAMDHLAEWATAWGDAPANVRHLQGDALYHQARTAKSPDRYLAAIEAYKAAAHGAGRDPETKQYAVTAWRAIGACYEALDQYRDAAMAYGRGAKRVDLDRALAAECASRCYSAWRRAVEADPTPSNRDEMRQARTRLITNFPERDGAADLAFYAARDLEKEGKYLEAAQAFDSVADGAPKKSQAVARAGGCYYREYARRSAHAKDAGSRLTPSDTALLSEAQRRCTRFLEIPGGKASARALATYYLGRIAAERGDHAEVVKLFGTFDETFGESQAKLVSDVLYLGVRSAVQVPDVTAAEAILARLLRHAPTHALCSPALLEVAKLVDAPGDRPVRAAELYLQWLDHTPDAGDAATLAVGVRVRKVADTVLADDARRWWERAGELLRPLDADPGELTAAQQGIVLHHLWKTEHALALLYGKAGELKAALDAWNRAEPLVAKLHDEHPTNATIINARLRCLRELIAAGDDDRSAQVVRLKAARELCAALVRGRRQFSPEWWQAKEWQFEAFYGLREFQRVVDLIENLKLVAPQMGNEPMRGRLLALQERAEAKAPKSKRSAKRGTSARK